MLRLYDSLLSGNCYKVRLLLAQLGIPWERVEVDVLQRQTLLPAVAEKNPAGRVPILELEDGRTLSESNAILWYLAEGTPFLPADRFERMQVLQWQFFEQNGHEPNIAVARYWMTLLGSPPDLAQALQQRQQAGMAILQVMDRYLERREFFVGERYSIADISLYAYTHVADEGDFDLAPYPAVLAWLERVAGAEGHQPMRDRETR